MVVAADADVLGLTLQSAHAKYRENIVMIKRLAVHRVAKARTSVTAPTKTRAPSITTPGMRRSAGDHTIGTEHLVLALLIDPASPAAEALRCDLGAARSALDELDNQALAAIGVEPGVTAAPVAARASRRLRLSRSLGLSPVPPRDPGRRRDDTRARRRDGQP